MIAMEFYAFFKNTMFIPISTSLFASYYIQCHLSNAWNIFLLYWDFKINIVNYFITEKLKGAIAGEFIGGLTQEPISMQLKENKTTNMVLTHLLWKLSPPSAFPA